MLVSALLLAAQSQKIDLSRYVPGAPYKIISKIDADFMGTGKKQTAILATAQASDADPADFKHRGPVVVIVDSIGRILWMDKAKQCGAPEPAERKGTNGIQAIDLNADGHPELIIISETVGASGGEQNIRILSAIRGEMRDILRPGMKGYRSNNPLAAFYDPQARKIVIGFAQDLPTDKGLSNAERRSTWMKETLRLKGRWLSPESYVAEKWPKTWALNDVRASLQLKSNTKLITWFYL